MADVTMPQLGETVTEGTITRWFKQVGDEVALDEILFEVSTDKVDTEVPSPIAGTLIEIFANEGDLVEVGQVLATIGDAVAATTPAEPEVSPETETETEPETEPAPEPQPEPEPEPQPEPEPEPQPEPEPEPEPQESVSTEPEAPPAAATPRLRHCRHRLRRLRQPGPSRKLRRAMNPRVGRRVRSCLP